MEVIYFWSGAAEEKWTFSDSETGKQPGPLAISVGEKKKKKRTERKKKTKWRAAALSFNSPLSCDGTK